MVKKDGVVSEQARSLDKLVIKPKVYQQTAYDFLQGRKRSGLFLDMGLGKTVIVLTWLKHLVWEELIASRVLVVGPKKVVEFTWPREIEKWAHTSDLTYSVVTGSEKDRVNALDEGLSGNTDLFLINRENVTWLFDSYLKGKRTPFDVLVIDESSSFKNRSSKRWKSLKKRVFQIPRVVLLTGTPAPNGYLDLWAQVYMLDGGKRLGPTFETYKRAFFEVDPKTWYSPYPKFVLREGMDKAIRDKISDICVYMDSRDHTDIPEVTYNTVNVYLSPGAKRKYDEFEKNSVLEFIESGETLSAETASALSNKLLQFAGGAVYVVTGQDENGKDKRTVQRVHDEKLDALEGVLEESQGHNLLVAYTFQHERDRILERFKGVAKMLDTRQDERDWNEGKIRMLLMHPASGGHGLNLQDGGHIAVWYSTWWDLELYQQFNRRLPRPGQKRGVIIHHLVTMGTEDERVLPTLNNKGNIQQGLLDGIKAKIERYKKGVD